MKRLAVLAALLAGCHRLVCDPGELAEGCPAFNIPLTLSEAAVCPAERIVLRPRLDLSVHRFACVTPEAKWAQTTYYGTTLWSSPSSLAAHCAERPSREIAADPERLALWRRLRDEPLVSFDTRFSAVYEVTACGQRGFYACTRTTPRMASTDHCDRRWLVLLGDREPPVR